ncbi:MAG: mechanosensitive ion channel domain-containing protein, partial [Pseudomonadota bacterium]|nr:mechanosensitive ion channel domain-containing protein [Pseudomonadota bacterium]
VALFAQWSLLSNATASIIVFFFFPYRAGNWVEIIDGDNTVIGKIKEITLFHVIMLDDQGAIVTYPNSLVFQKAVRITRKKPTKKESDSDLES